MKRLREDPAQASAFERELLASARSDRMDAAARAAAIAAATSSSGLLAVKATASALRSTKIGALLGAQLGTKAVVLGLVTLTAAGAASVLARSRPPRAPATAFEAPASRASALPRTTPPLANAPAAAPAPASASAPARFHAHPLPPPPAPSPPRPSLGDQSRLIESARLALRQGDPTLALSRLDDLDRLSPGDALAEEATLTRLEALTQVDPDAARRLGAAYLAAHPDGAYVHRVTRLLARLDPGSTP